MIKLKTLSLFAHKLDTGTDKLIDIITTSFEALTVISPNAAEEVLTLLNEQLPEQVAKIKTLDESILNDVDDDITEQ